MGKIVNTRIQYKHDTPSAWKDATSIPLNGELLAYAETEVVMVKVGDNQSQADNLPFIRFEEGIKKLKTPSVSTNSIVYNGTEQSPNLINYDSRGMLLSGDLSATDAGTYTIIVTPQEGYCWEDGSIVGIELTWSISKASVEITVSGGTSITLTEPLTTKYISVLTPTNITWTPTYHVTSNNTSIVTAAGLPLSRQVSLSPGTTNGTTNVTVEIDCGSNYEKTTVILIVTNNAAVSETLNDNSWETISKVAAAGKASTVWKVGDCKAVTVNGHAGKLTVNETYYVYIIGFNHNGSTNTIDFGTFKTAATSGVSIALTDEKYNLSYLDGTEYFNMNHSTKSTTANSWATCDIRHDVLGSSDIVGASASSTATTSPDSRTLMAALPEDLREVMKPINITTMAAGSSTTSVNSYTEYLPLLSVKEIGATSTDVSTNESNTEATYTYYSSGNSSIKYRDSAITTSCYYWTRSIKNTSRQNFMYANTSDKSVTYRDQSYCHGIAPIFRV